MPFNASIRRKFATIAFKSLQHHGVDYLHNCNDRRAWAFSLSPIFLKFFGKISVFFGLRIKFHNSCKPWVRRMPKLCSSTHHSTCLQFYARNIQVPILNGNCETLYHVQSCTFNKNLTFFLGLLQMHITEVCWCLSSHRRGLPLAATRVVAIQAVEISCMTKFYIFTTILNQLTFSTVQCIYIAYGLPNCLPCSLQQKSLIVLSGLSCLRVVQLGSWH